MTSKTVALTILDWIFMAGTILMLFVIAGCPVGWLLRLTDMSLREFEWFALFIVFSTLGLIHAIATSDSAP
jgi:hypothetical protein